jgi:hypothetical protein
MGATLQKELVNDTQDTITDCQKFQKNIISLTTMD